MLHDGDDYALCARQYEPLMQFDLINKAVLQTQYDQLATAFAMQM